MAASSAVLGTHTHVPTADECILPDGTAFQCDVGMTGPYESIIGRRIDRVLETTLTGLPTEFDVATKTCASAARSSTSTPQPARQPPWNACASPKPTCRDCNLHRPNPGRRSRPAMRGPVPLNDLVGHTELSLLVLRGA